jgi:hypothetical protein
MHKRLYARIAITDEMIRAQREIDRQLQRRMTLQSLPEKVQRKAWARIRAYRWIGREMTALLEDIRSRGRTV